MESERNNSSNFYDNVKCIEGKIKTFQESQEYSKYLCMAIRKQNAISFKK